MAFLFDTDAISELLRPRPAMAYINWLMKVSREEQFTSAVVIGELYKGAYRSQARERHLTNIEQRVLPAVTVLMTLARRKFLAKSGLILKKQEQSFQMRIFRLLPQP